MLLDELSVSERWCGRWDFLMVVSQAFVSLPANLVRPARQENERERE